MKLRDHLAYLEQIGGADTTHSGRSLNEHLTGTYDILRSWDSRDYVCLAGLFHSVYGTQKFKPALLDHTKRFEVVQRIGPRAELLVFFFSLLSLEDLKNAFPNGNKTSIVWDDMEIELTTLQYTQLVELSLANFIEQIPHLVDGKDSDFEQYQEGWDWITGVVSKKIEKQFTKAIRQLRADAGMKSVQ